MINGAFKNLLYPSGIFIPNCSINCLADVSLRKLKIKQVSNNEGRERKRNQPTQSSSLAKRRRVMNAAAAAAASVNFGET